MRLIDVDALIEYANNQKDKTIDANDIARFPTAVDWISVKDRLPDAAGVPVLVTAVNRFNQVTVFTAFPGYGDFKWYTSDVFHMGKDCDEVVSQNWEITHWMPLPEPSEVVKQDD